MRHWFLCWLFGVTTLSYPTIGAVAQGRADAVAAEVTGKQPARSADELRDARDRLDATARKLRSEGKFFEAAEAREQMLAVEREWLGEDHEEVILSLEWLAEVYEELEDFDAAEAKRKTVLNWRERQQGENHWETVDARLAVTDVARVRALEGTQRRELAEATRQYQEISRLYRTGAHPTAVKLAQEVLLIHKRLLGEEHPLYAASLSNLGILYESMGDYARAETLYTQSLETTRKVKGDEHPDYAHCLNNLADLHSRQGAYATAEPIYRQALKIRKKTLGEQHLDYGISLNSLAALHVYAGEHARAEPLFRQALEISRKTLGEQHPSYATGLANLAQVYRSTGDFARAEALLKQGLEIRRKAFGEEHPDYASCLDDLGCLYSAAGDFERAEPPLTEAREIRKRAYGEQHPIYAYSLNNLANLYSMRGGIYTGGATLYPGP